MRIRQRSVRHGIAWALLVALAVAIVTTFIDWNGNPGQVFRGPHGTNWNAVIETFWSWLWPVFTAATPVAVLVHAGLAQRQPGSED